LRNSLARNIRSLVFESAIPSLIFYATTVNPAIVNRNAWRMTIGVACRFEVLSDFVLFPSGQRDIGNGATSGAPPDAANAASGGLRAKARLSSAGASPSR